MAPISDDRAIGTISALSDRLLMRRQDAMVARSSSNLKVEVTLVPSRAMNQVHPPWASSLTLPFSPPDNPVCSSAYLLFWPRENRKPFGKALWLTHSFTMFEFVAVDPTGRAFQADRKRIRSRQL